MPLLYVYAIVGSAPRVPGRGIGGEPLVTMAFDGGAAIAGWLDALPRIDEDRLRAQDAIVRRLAADTDAILPARFGASVASAIELRSALDARLQTLRDELARVAGREQMTLRIGGQPEKAHARPAPADPPQEDAALGEGTRYLRARARAEEERRQLPELAALRPVLDPFVAEERVERHHTPPLLASVYHLIRRGESEAYRKAVTGAADALSPLTIRMSGPSPPYAFADGVLL